MAFEQKAPSAVAKASKDVGEYTELLIEKHEKDSDMLKLFGTYRKAVGAEKVKMTDEGMIIRFPKANAEAYQKKCMDDANARMKRTGGVNVADRYKDIAEVTADTVQNVSHQELLGG